MAASNLGEQLGAQLVKAAQIMEEHIDNEMNRAYSSPHDSVMTSRRGTIDDTLSSWIGIGDVKLK
ncbi:hypothetical protein Aduo_007705 [Ancylostoma duodenale]